MKREASAATAAAIVAAFYCATAAHGADGGAADLAAAFGALPQIEDAALSPDGKRIVLVQPTTGTTTAVTVVDVATGAVKIVSTSDGKPLRLTYCGWSSNDRIVCGLYGLSEVNALLTPWTRIVALNADGGKLIELSHSTGIDALRISQFAGSIVDWRNGDGTILMARDVVPEETTGHLIKHDEDGLDVETVNTANNASRMIEHANPVAGSYLSDGNGTIRIMEIDEQQDQRQTGVTVYEYRMAGSRDWKPFSRVVDNGPGMTPIAVDGTRNVAYALEKKDGRNALYRVSLGGSLTQDLVYADPAVDVEGVITVGRQGRVIGFSYTTDQRVVRYFDPDYQALAQKIGHALPDRPQIEFVSTSADERTILIAASGPTHPSHYYLLDRQTMSMQDILPQRPKIETLKPASVKAISYKAADGTVIPAYLTLPPDSDGKHLPGLVMPHGGPDYRDSGGYDDLAQFFAERGFAVIQPEFRGSSGYGDAFFNKNGFVSWRTAIGDVNDAGRWLVSQGIADADKLAIFGWSYGGYAALQANVLDPALFKAVVAVAPVTDFDMAKQEFRDFTNYDLVVRQVGDETVAKEGSPDRHADLFRAPVLMFHGDKDRNVSVAESRAMDSALRKAGKQSQLVIYPGLDHQLQDSAAMTDMLGKSDAFLRTTLKIAAP